MHKPKVYQQPLAMTVKMDAHTPFRQHQYLLLVDTGGLLRSPQLCNSVNDKLIHIFSMICLIRYTRMLTGNENFLKQHESQ